MFNTLASYILGTDSNYNNNTSTNKNEDNKTEGQLDKLNIVVKDLTEDEDDNDWLFVEKEEADSLPNTDSEEELPFVKIKNAPSIPTIVRGRHSRNNSGAGSHDGLFNLSPASILPNSMEESWFVTPPPCFTSTGPIVMETSPLENLLIEHPSMSVYHRATSTLRDDVDEDDMVVVLDLTSEHPHPAAERSPNHTVRLTRCRPEHLDHHNTNGNHHHMKQYMTHKNLTKNNDRKLHQSMCRSALERSNKVREINCKGGRQKRSDMNHCKIISRANNNRKC